MCYYLCAAFLLALMMGYCVSCTRCCGPSCYDCFVSGLIGLGTGWEDGELAYVSGTVLYLVNALLTTLMVLLANDVPVL